MAVPFKRVLKSGMKGNDVFAVKRALKAKGLRQGIDPHRPCPILLRCRYCHAARLPA